MNYWEMLKVKRKFCAWVEYYGKWEGSFVESSSIFSYKLVSQKMKKREKKLILQKKLEIRFLEVGTYEKQVQIYVDLSVAKSSKE